MARDDFRGLFPSGRGYRRRWSWGGILFLFLLTLLLARRGYEIVVSEPTSQTAAVLHEGVYDLVRVVDGDTLVVRPAEDAGGSSGQSLQAYVRLIGIDTPETVKPDHPIEPWGPEATEFTRRFLASGRLELRMDKRRKDRYDRFLAYVYVDGRMLNEELVRAGLARVSHYPGDSPRIARQLQEAEEEARRARRGIWSP